MDEVHYLADRFRGAVWEEVILQLPEHVRLVSLSATVSNAEEFGDWLVTVRGDTTVVVDEHRPVPLWQHMMVGNRLLDLFAGETAAGELAVDPDLVRHTRDLERQIVVWDRGRGRGRAGDRSGGHGRGAAVPVPSAVPGDRARPAGPGRPAAGHHVRVQPSRLRRRGRPVRARRAAVDHRGRGGGDPAHGGAAHRRAAAGRPGRARLLGVAGGAAARHRGPPRRAAAGVQGDRRGAVRARAGARGVRHRDAGAGHQHAGPHGGAGAAGQVQRRGARRAHSRRVHPAHRSGRAARHRRRGARGRGVAARGRSGAGGRAGLHPHVPAAQLVPAGLQHGRQPRRAVGHRRGPGPAGAVLRAVPGRPVGGRAGPADRTQHRGDGRLRRIDEPATWATSPSTRACAGASPSGRSR